MTSKHGNGQRRPGYSAKLEQLVHLYGIKGVVFFAHHPGSPYDGATANHLASVGLPHGRVFTSQVDTDGSERLPAEVGPRSDLYDQGYPDESRKWHVLGHLPTALVTIDPSSGRVYAFPEGESEYQLLHRDAQSFTYCLAEFHKVDETYRATYPDTPDVDALVEGFREKVSRFDASPFEDPDSVWNLMLEEVLDEIW
ncbi:SUKH-4 family immunity protein [Streptomyces chitinivorans]|uniref:SUKH-4 family immunity protein n=1 Tax=Streptomyces chitinivorans TaxID=1257027 RepID=A0ABW7HX50_9ACTN|nr:SUKH-4 family immunity protein [Streptomyces chitinivorans]MDH2407523.1 SUKH-4 family immunity protein [Streptomyces chitinivorans]